MRLIRKYWELAALWSATFVLVGLMVTGVLPDRIESTPQGPQFGRSPIIPTTSATMPPPGTSTPTTHGGDVSPTTTITPPSIQTTTTTTPPPPLSTTTTINLPIPPTITLPTTLPECEGRKEILVEPHSRADVCWIIRPGCGGAKPCE